jgi:hypothetical protein
VSNTPPDWGYRWGKDVLKTCAGASAIQCNFLVPILSRSFPHLIHLSDVSSDCFLGLTLRFPLFHRDLYILYI